ncbi:DUF1800 domain-containing protein [Mangrovicoccus algicola]|uniref:DUF1800 domain-containing protein n=1 Tax=Mangrovicoccus algicola TaxID=2771008 RepID=A0A8J7CML8_9RHOB|nr:DUF1800 domain-containing protein [Mangrovicoccus algicola]MBE3640591.1 DUF1800 domain-containing protein [Mangrovicoccus algicola]
MKIAGESPTVFQPALAAIRFGTGRSPLHPDPEAPAAMLAALAAPDAAAGAFPVSPVEDVLHWVEPMRELQRAGRGADAQRLELLREIRKAERPYEAANLAAVLARGIGAGDGFRDRLTLFWADHFATAGRGPFLRNRVDSYVDAAIRPHVAGRFEDLLKAAVLHPVMLKYLDQTSSIGPESRVAQKGGRGGLNENLGREVLELHTLGVGGSYGQQDVRQMAELLAGVTMTDELETVFRQARAEPGAEHVLGFSSNARRDRMWDVEQALTYLARHPDTAAHLSRKLAVHFLSDAPPDDLVTAMTTRYRETGGDLAQVYAAMLDHPASWDPTLHKIRRPVDFVMASLRGLGADPRALVTMAEETPQRIYGRFMQPMRFMGQDWNEPEAPNGWPEEAAAWVSATALSERLKWALRVTELPGVPQDADPVRLAEAGLGALLPEEVRFAAGAAETRREGIALVLVSPAFQRR